MTGPFSTESWKRLAAQAQRLQDNKVSIRDLFAADPQRAKKFSLTTARLHFDYSKNLLDDGARENLLALAEECRVADGIAAMFAGEEINPTEHRPALHVVLRGHSVKGLEHKVNEVLGRLDRFVLEVSNGRWRGFDGKRITDVVNIGIGGSHLGPAMVVRALRPYQSGRIRMHFLSNVDPSAAEEVLRDLDPGATLFIIASKSFTTLETHQNALLARQWFLRGGAAEAQMSQHFVAVSSNVAAAKKFGILPENVFPMWDWVGGRYSLWSAIGLPIALGLGMETFRQLLSGAHAADEHFRQTPLAENIPVWMALLNFWYSECFGAASQVILPYSQHLELFPAFLQQLCMESLGKSVNLDGSKVDGNTGMILWGAPGTDGQHSFHQLLHQGTRLVPADFIALANPTYKSAVTQHHHLLANCFSQSQALMDGKSLEQSLDELTRGGMAAEEARRLAPHKVIPGNRPSNTLLLDQLDPFNLGYLTALYEHSVYVQSLLLHINAFDQWGVELGKQLSGPLFTAIDSNAAESQFDASTNQLLHMARHWRES